MMAVFPKDLRLVVDLAPRSEVHLACLVELVQDTLSSHPVYAVHHYRLGNSK